MKKIGTKFIRQWPWACNIYSTYASGAKQMSLKQIIQIKHYMVKNPIGSEVNQLAIYKRLRIWTWDYREQIQLAARAGLELGDSRLHIQCSNHSAMLPLTYNNKFFLTTTDPNLNFTNVTFKGLCWRNLSKISTSSWIRSILPIGLNMYLGNLTCLSWHQTQLCGDHLDFSNKLEKKVPVFQKRGYRPRRSALFSRERLTINTTTSEKETNKRIIPLVHPHISPRQSRSKRASSLKIIGRKFSHSPPM